MIVFKRGEFLADLGITASGIAGGIAGAVVAGMERQILGLLLGIVFAIITFAVYTVAVITYEIHFVPQTDKVRDDGRKPGGFVP